MLIESESGKRMLIDCGGDVRFSLAEQKLSSREIDSVYISHLHADHVGGLEWLGFTTYFNQERTRSKLFAGEDVLAELWEHTLQGGMRSDQGSVAGIETFFDVHPIVGEGAFIWEGMAFQLVQVSHINDGARLMPSYGICFDLNDRTVLLTTDTQYTPERLAGQYASADIIFHDCEVSPYKSGVHACYNELKALPPEIRAKMWLYHYQPGPLPDAVADGFLGFVVKGQTF